MEGARGVAITVRNAVHPLLLLCENGEDNRPRNSKEQRKVYDACLTLFLCLFPCDRHAACRDRKQGKEEARPSLDSLPAGSIVRPIIIHLRSRSGTDPGGPGLPTACKELSTVSSALANIGLCIVRWVLS